MEVFAYCQGNTVAVVVLQDSGKIELLRTLPMKGKTPLVGGVLGAKDIVEHEVMSRAMPLKLNVNVDARQAFEGAIAEMVRVLQNTQ